MGQAPEYSRGRRRSLEQVHVAQCSGQVSGGCVINPAANSASFAAVIGSISVGPMNQLALSFSQTSAGSWTISRYTGPPSGGSYVAVWTYRTGPPVICLARTLRLRIWLTAAAGIIALEQRNVSITAVSKSAARTDASSARERRRVYALE